MVKPLTFKGDKTKKRKHVRTEDEPGTGIESSSALTTSNITVDAVEEDDYWVTAELPTDIAGPVLFAMPTIPPACLACDANGKVFTSEIENMVEKDPASAEPHDVRQVWVANKVAGTDFISFKGHHGRYLGCDKDGKLFATQEAISAEEQFLCILSTDSPGTFSIKTQREKYFTRKEELNGIEVQGSADNGSTDTLFHIRMQARYKPRLKANKESKARAKVSRRELEEVVGRRLDDDEVKRLKRARREGDYHETILDELQKESPMPQKLYQASDGYTCLIQLRHTPGTEAPYVTDRTFRHYSTTEPSSNDGSNAALFTFLAAAAGGGGAYYYYSSVAERPNAAEPGTPASKAERITIPGQAAKSAAFTGGDQGWIDLKLGSVQKINHNTSKFRFELPSKDDVSGLQTASALLSKYQGPKMEKPVIRPYTPVSDEDQRGYIDFVIKKYEGGSMSTHMHDMEPPQRLSFKGPIPKYPYSPNKHTHIALIAGGTGITPMYQLINTIFKNADDKTKISLVYANVTENDILLKREFEEFENTFPQRFRAFYVLDKPPNAWAQGKGRIDKELLKTVLPEPKTENIKIFVCGPPGMYKAVSGMKPSPTDQGELEGILKELGYTKDQVYKF
ncbi:MAG: NADH-cytochrome b5 reductase [Icmadophila ericetorum]|nr:NADH-cytochrome b5 reductase [Icmadophila ericetorum]